MNWLNDESYMRIALRMAEQTQGQTGVNPAVGCVVVNHGRIVGMGAHLDRGGPHAEVHALDMAGSEAAGSTVYVTLEPCSHHGRTPPCSDRLIREKVGRVVVAAADPNPLVAGSGMNRLRERGIEVVSGVLEAEARRLNESFEYFISQRRPFVTLKTASTLDGKIASKTGDSRYVSGEQSRELAHQLRHKNQAILVGVDTVIADNPRLTARLSVPCLSPRRIVADSGLRTPLSSHVAADGEPSFFLTTERADPAAMERLRSLGHEVIACGPGPHVDLPLAMEKLGQMEIGSVLLEGGGRLNGHMLRHGLIHKLYLIFAPKIIGGEGAPGSFRFDGFDRMEDAVVLRDLTVERFGQDICVIGYPDYRRGKE